MTEHTFEIKTGSELVKRILSDEDVARVKEFAKKLGRPPAQGRRYASGGIPFLTYLLPHDPDWDKVVEASVRDKFYDAYPDWDGFKHRFVVYRGASSLVAAIGVPKTHPIAGFTIDELPLTVHGGLMDSMSGMSVDKDYHWYLWHYGHSTLKDFDVNDADLRKGTVSRVRMEKTGWTRWTLPLILKDAKPAREQFDKLLHIAETVAARELAYEEAAHV